MVKGPFGLPRLTSLGPLTTDYQDTEAFVSTQSDVKELAAELSDSNAISIQGADYQGYFSDPSGYIDFIIPPKVNKTFEREAGNSAVVFEASNGLLSNMTVRLPSINKSDSTEGELRAIIESTVADSFSDFRPRARIATYDPNSVYHPHFHYSKQIDGGYGPPITVVIEGLKQVPRAHYKRIRRRIQ